MSQVIDIISSIQPQVYLDASIPYFNGVYLIHGDSLEAGISGIYYGDEVNLLFWEQLSLRMGSGSVYSSLYTLLPGYKYIYYLDGNRFIIYDNDDNIIFENAIHSLDDFCIDFSVYKSHQFEIHVSSFGDAFSFYKLARWNKKLCESTLNFESIGINNENIPDRIRPYGKGDFDNPSWDIGHIGHSYVNNSTYSYDFTYFDVISDLAGFILGNIQNDNVVANNNFYCSLEDFSVVGRLMNYKIGATKLSLDVVLPKLSKLMYPALMGTNFVLYEPWLIWGIYKILYSKRIVDIEGEDFEVFPFDLSPLWG